MHSEIQLLLSIKQPLPHL